jgi:hypothetical protein
MGLLSLLMVSWPKVHNWAKTGAKAPTERAEAGPTGITDVPRYMQERYIDGGVWKLQLDDVFFRTIES